MCVCVCVCVCVSVLAVIRAKSHTLGQICKWRHFVTSLFISMRNTITSHSFNIFLGNAHAVRPLYFLVAQFIVFYRHVCVCAHVYIVTLCDYHQDNIEERTS